MEILLLTKEIIFDFIYASIYIYKAGIFMYTFYIDITYITKIEPIFGTITINENLFVVVSFLNIMNNILVNKTRVLLYLIKNNFMQINHHKSYKNLTT